MTTDNEVVLGVSDVSKPKIDSSSYTDPLKVSTDCNGTKLDDVSEIGNNDNVLLDDPDGDSCVVTNDGPNCIDDSGGAILVVDSKVLDLQNGKVVGDIVQSPVIDETFSTGKDMRNGTDVEEHEPGQLTVEDNSEVGVDSRGIVECVDEYHYVSMSNEKEEFLQGKVNYLPTDDLELEQPNGAIIDNEEHYKVEVEDPKAFEVSSKHQNSDSNADAELDSAEKNVMSSYTDSLKVSTDCNRTKLDDLNEIGDTDNVLLDYPDGSYVSDGDSCVVTNDGPNCINDSGGAILVVDSKVLDLQNGKVVGDIVQSPVIDETFSTGIDMQNGTDVEQHEHEQLTVEDNSEVGLDSRGIVECVDEYHSVSLSNEKEEFLQGKVNYLPTDDDELEQPNGAIIDNEEHYKVEVEDPKAFEVTSKHQNSDSNADAKLDSAEKIVVEEEAFINGRMVESTLLDKNQCVSLSSCSGEVNNRNNTVHQPNGPDLEEHDDLQLDSEAKIEDQSPNHNKDSDVDTIKESLQPAMPLEAQNLDCDVPINEMAGAPVPDVVSGTEEHCEGLLFQANDTGDLPLTILELSINPENAESPTKENAGELPVESDENLQPNCHDLTLVRKDDSVASTIRKHVESESAPHSYASSPTSESKVEHGTNIMPGGAALTLTGIEFGSFRPSDMIFSVFPSQVPSKVAELAHNPTISNLKNDQPVPIGSYYHVNSKSLLQNSSAVTSSDIPNKDATIHGSDVPVVRGKNGDAETLQLGDDKPDGTHQISNNGSNATLLRASVEVMDTIKLGDEAGSKRIRFIVKIPRFDDEKLRVQLRTAQLLLDEKTRLRDGIQIEVQKKRNSCHVLNNEFRDARSEEIAARKLLKLKRQDIDSVQVVINRVKNAISLGDIDSRISGLEHKIEHETIPLKEEKLVIREIKQMKLLRDQLLSNMSSQDEVKQVFDQRDHIDGRLKILKKELDGLKDKVSKAEAATSLLRKKYDDENEKLKELHAQFKNTNDIRQEAYKHFSAVKGELKEKNKYFWMYKDDVKAATDYALCGDREALHSLCVNQVETMMELWNNNDEFRKEYVRCNMRSTVRRFKTLDGRSLGPDEEAIVLPSYADRRANMQHSSASLATSSSMVSTLEQKKPVPSVEEDVVGGGKSIKVAEQKNHTRKSDAGAHPIPRSGSKTVSSKVETRETNSDEDLQIEEQLESATKAEKLREKERDEELKEKRRLEEKAKAQEALERKKRIAEKAQIRAEMRAQKEAEQKQKEREKRLRKKERKSAAVDAKKIDTNGQCATALEVPDEIAKEFVVEENSTAAVKRPNKTSINLTKQSKTKVIPPPLRNRGTRKWKQAILWIIVIVIVIFVIFGGENGALGGRKSHKNPSSRR